MTTEQFAYWLQGFAELSGERPTVEQWQSVREHLATVFNKVTPEIRFNPVNIGVPPKLSDLIGKINPEFMSTRITC